MWPQPGGWGQAHSQWPMQQSAYAHMAHDQVDWAALAKQWMQYKDAGAATNVAPANAAPPPPPPSNAANGGTWNGPVWNKPPADDHQAWSGAVSTDWTAGVDSMSKDEATDPSLAIDYNHGTQHQRGDNSNNSIGHVASAPSSAPPPSQFNQGYDYSQQSYPPPGAPWSAATASATPAIDFSKPPPGFASGPPAAAAARPPAAHGAPTHPQHHHHHSAQQQHVSPHFNVAGAMDPAFLDAAKRKSLPAWIREGLEKMEKEKAKKEEVEREAKQREERRKQEEEERRLAEEEAERTGIPVKSKFEDDDGENSDDGETNAANLSTSAPAESSPPARSYSSDHVTKRRSRSPTPEEEYMTPEERQEALMLKVKRMVTDVLLTVTNEEIEDICTTVYNQCKKKAKAAPAKMLAKSNALASLTSSFGGYDSEISEEDEMSDLGSGDERGSGSDDESAISRRRQEFSSKQRERLRVIENDEREAMAIFMGAGQSKASKSDGIPGLDARASRSRSPSERDQKRNDAGGKRSAGEDKSDSRRRESKESRRDSQRERSRSADGHRRRSRSRDRGERKRSRERERRRSRSRDRLKRDRSPERRSSKDTRRHRSRSDSKESRDRRSKRSRSRDRKRRSRSRSREKDRRSSKHSRKDSPATSSDRHKHRSRSRSADKRKRSRRDDRSGDSDSSSESYDKRKSSKVSSSRRSKSSSSTSQHRKSSSRRRDGSSDSSS